MRGAPTAALLALLAALGTRQAEAVQAPAPLDLRTYADDGGGTEPDPWAGPSTWGLREVEHLWNRAAFGAPPSALRDWVARGPVAAVEHLLAAETTRDPFYARPVYLSLERQRDLDAAQRRALRRRLRTEDRAQFRAFVAHWFERMLSDEAPLRERMTLFWHGLFTSSYETVRRSELMIAQNRLLRENALGSYAKILSGILRDPAMLVYLDNDESRRDHPNENLARELLELFSLGEGHFSERDVKEAARALTGRGVSRGRYEFDEQDYDGGSKRILGHSGRIGGGQLVRLILEQPACSRQLARRLITWFEGVEPTPDRLQGYAELLVREDWQLQPFLRRLFLDPEFYRDEVVGARVSSPVDFLVGSARRLGTRPPPAFLAAGSDLLGQGLLEPPNVKGWEEGEAWISTGSLMARGNLAGVMLGVIDAASLGAGRDRGREETREMSSEEEQMIAQALAESDQAGESSEEDPGDPMEEGAIDPRMGETATSASGFVDLGDRVADGGLARILRALDRIDYRPDINLTARLAGRGLESAREIAVALLDELLASEPSEATIEAMSDFLREEGDQLGLREDRFLAPLRDVEPLLRRAAHRILALPEAQLH